MSNFVEIEIGGKLRAFRFGLEVIGDIQEHLDLDIAGVGRMSIRNPFKIVPVIFFYGHKYETQERGRLVDFTISDFAKWIGEFEDTYAHPDIDGVLKVFFDTVIKYTPGAKKVEAELKKVEEKKSSTA